MSVRRRTALLLLLVLPPLGVTAGPAAAGPPGDRQVLLGYARDTWRSMVALTDPGTGLPADNMTGSVTAPVRSGYTSPTNIGGYLWSTVVARDTGVIDSTEAYRRLRQTLGTLGRMERHPDSGMFYNWYDEATAAKLTTWPVDGSPLTPFLSSVDNGWLATALMIVSSAEPRLRRQAGALLGPMDFGFFYNPAPARPGVDAGLNRGGFWDTQPPGCSVVGNYRGRGPDVWYTCNSYDTAVTEARIALYVGIARGQIPPAAYFATWRTFPASCDWSWQEQQPVGVDPDLPRHPGLRGRVPLPRAAAGAELGRRHVRVADAGPVRAGGGVGTAQLAGQPPADRPLPDRARAARGRLRLLGLLAGVDPRRRLPGVRRGRGRDEPGRLLLRRRADELRRRLRRLPGRDRTRPRRTGTEW